MAQKDNTIELISKIISFVNQDSNQTFIIIFGRCDRTKHAFNGNS